MVTAGAGVRIGPFAMNVKHDGPFEAFFMSLRATQNDGTIFIEHAGKRKYLMNRPIHVMTLKADAGRAGVLAETIWIPAIQGLFVTFENFSGSSSDYEFVLSGVKYYQNNIEPKLRSELLAYTQRRERTNCYFLTSDEDISMPALGAAAVIRRTANFTVPDDADFEIFGLSIWTDQAIAGAIRGRIFDGATDRALSNSPVHVSMLGGGQVATAMAGQTDNPGGIYKKRYATSWLVRRGTRFRIEWESTVNAVVRVFPTFWGRKISYQ